MLQPFATAQDVADRWRPLSDVEQTVADTLVGDASALIRAEFPGIDSQVTGGQVDATVLTLIVASMVKRALISPDEGVTQQSESVGPFSRSQTYANPMRNLFITASDRLLILGRTSTGRSYKFGNTTTRSWQS